MENNKKILLHVCCATCGAGCVERLKELDFSDIVLFEFNPNIYPIDEYERRKKDMISLSEIKKIPLYTGAYDHEEWLKQIEGLQKEPEGGKRCDVCFKLRLKMTAKKSKELNIRFFTTTLTVSPHKNFKRIELIGKEAGKEYEVDFYSTDFKKNDGFKKSIEASKKYGFYRQNYCGCEFSIRKKA
ncbi:MAG: epoxyqueuosine reductase QueH [Candidatus Aureabacteria bacterium]|nr:epoxyqueuosine reductase QueH [Candidatus Auribacterota bacterium]